MKNALLIAALVFALGAQAGYQAIAQAQNFKLDDINQFVFEENPQPGTRNYYRVVQARVSAWPTASDMEMNSFAETLQNSRLREVAQQSDANMIWVTFYTERLPRGGDSWKTYRVIYQKDAGRWRMLKP